MLFVILCLLWTVSFGMNFAQAEPSYTADELIELAVSKNPELRAMQLEAESEKSLAAASKWKNPELELGGERKQQPAGRTDFTRVGISIEIPRPSRLSARERLARTAASTAELDARNHSLHLRSEVLRLITEYQATKEKAAHAQERLERFQTVGIFLRSRVFAAPQKQAEATIVRSKLLLVSREFRQLAAARRLSWNKLNMYLGLPTEPRIKAAWISSASQPDLQDLLARAEKNSPDLRIQEMQLSLRQTELELARTENWPGITLGTSYSNGTGADPERVYGLGVSFPLPVLNTQTRNVVAGEARLSAQRERNAWVRREITERITSAFERYMAARQSIEELKITDLPRLEREMKTIDSAFKKGQVDLLTYIEADAEHADVLNAMLDSQVDFVSARSALDELTGQTAHGQE